LAVDERFPGQPAVGRLWEVLRKGRRTEELENLGSTVVKCFLAGELDEAAGRIAGAKSEFGAEPVWRDLHQQLEFRRNYERILHETEKLRLQGKHEPAEDLLRSVLEDAPDARAAALHRSISAELIRKQRDDAIAHARREVARFLDKENMAEALGILDRICEKYPDELELADRRKDVADRAEWQRRELERQETERRRAAERTHKILGCRSAVDAAVKSSLWDEALRAIAAYERDLPNDATLVELRRQVEDQKRRATLEILVGRVQKSLSRGDLDGAARQIGGARLDFSDEPIWETLQEEIARHRQYESLLTDAQNLIIDARYDPAQQKLREAVALNSADARAAELLKEIGNEKNVRLRLSVQLRLMVRKYGRAIKVTGITVGLLFGVGIAGHVWRGKTPPPPITLVYKPTEVKLLYRVGDQMFPRDSVQFQPARVDFEVTPEADWLRVSPMKGSSLDRLDLEVTKAPNTSSHVHTILVVHAKGRPVTNDVVLIPVDLDVRGTEGPKIPGAPPPKPLTLDPALIEIEYRPGDTAPGRRDIRVTQGDAAGVSTSDNWLRAERTQAGIAVDFPVDRLRELKVGPKIGFVTVASRDKTVGTAQTTVVLTVTAMAEPVVIPAIPKKDTGPNEQKTVLPSPPQPSPPLGTGCDHGVWGDVDKGDATWRGKLPANTPTPLQMEQIHPKLPPRRPFTITIAERDVSVLQWPLEANRCGPLTVSTTRQDITVLHIHWVLASQ
jgi:tetratricopeptide (TPR) repeat protein